MAAAEFLMELQAVLRRLEFFTYPMKERGSQGVLEAGDRLAEGRRGNVQDFRGQAIVPRFHHLAEYGNFIEVYIV